MAADLAPTTPQGTARLRRAARLAGAPMVLILGIWTFAPLIWTLYYSTLRYKLLVPADPVFVGARNYVQLVTGPAFLEAFANTLILVSSVLAITVILGVLVATLLNRSMAGGAVVRMLVVAPFFVMPTVSALVWKNLLMDPVSGLFAAIAHAFSLPPIDWFGHAPLLAIIIIVAWEWLPFASLILLTALQSLDSEQEEAARLDGAGAWDRFVHLTLPHLSQPISTVILVELIFLLAVFAEILVTTNGGPGYATSNIAYLIFNTALLKFDVGAASAGGIVAVIIANLVALALVRLIGRRLDV